MPKKGQFNPRPGYLRIPGRARKYKRLSDGREISRTQYIKETEGVKSLEEKARMNAARREEYGLRKPQSRYNAIVEQYKLVNGKSAKVRGDSPEAIAFRENYAIFTKSTKRRYFKSERAWRNARLDHLDAGVELGIMTSEERDQYAGEE